MTFTEAALEVLRSVGKPLHYKKITELAIERNLLSHVGKTPEVTMSSRLATMVKKDRGEAPIVKLRPGVFGLRDAAKSSNGKSSDEASASIPPEQEQVEEQATPSTTPPKLPGADVFPEEEDDDELILAGIEEEERSAREGKRRRKRRRRRSKGDDGPSMPPSQPPPKAASPKPAKLRAPAPMDMGREPGEGDLLGKDLADAVYAVLHKAGQKPMTFADVADKLVRRGRMSGDAATLAPTIAAAVRADVATRERMAARPRFRVREGLVGLVDWYLPKEMVWAEDAAMEAVERQRDQARREVLRRLRDLPPAGFAELMATWLNAEGVVALRAVRRPTSSATEMHFAGMLKRGSEETRLAIMIRRDGKSLDRERVVEMRGSLHHYGQATACWLVSTGSLLSGAREEVEAVGAAPCALFDGNALVEAMERQGIGVRRQLVPLIGLDLELFEALGGGSPVIGAAPAPSEDGTEASGREKGKKRRSSRGERSRGGEERAKRRQHDTTERADEDGEAAAREGVASSESEENVAELDRQPPEGAEEVPAGEAAAAESDTAQEQEQEQEAEHKPAKRPARRRTRRREPREATRRETAEAEEATSAQLSPSDQGTGSEAEPSETTEAKPSESASEASDAESETGDLKASAATVEPLKPIPAIVVGREASPEPDETEAGREAAPDAEAAEASDRTRAASEDDGSESSRDEGSSDEAEETPPDDHS